MFSTAFSVGNRRPQKGHSKSENSTIVTGAVAGPREGCPAVATSVRAGSGFVADCGAAAVATARMTGVRKIMSLIIQGDKSSGCCVDVADGVMIGGKWPAGAS